MASTRKQRKHSSGSTLSEEVRNKKTPQPLTEAEVEAASYEILWKEHHGNSNIHQQAGGDTTDTPDSLITPLQEDDADLSELTPVTKKVKNKDDEIEENSMDRDEATPIVQQPVTSCMQEILEGAMELHTKWTETFRESESFEELAIVRAESLLKDGYLLKESLEAEKQEWVDRMRAITSILEKSPQN